MVDAASKLVVCVWPLGFNGRNLMLKLSKLFSLLYRPSTEFVIKGLHYRLRYVIALLTLHTQAHRTDSLILQGLGPIPERPRLAHDPHLVPRVLLKPSPLHLLVGFELNRVG